MGWPNSLRQWETAFGATEGLRPGRDERRAQDRRDLATWALAVLVYGLAFAPVLHAELQHLQHGLEPVGASWGHARSIPLGANSLPNSHRHDSNHKHFEGGVEHLAAFFVAAAAPHGIAPLQLALAWILSGEVRREQGSRPLHPEMKQGP